MPRYFFDIDDGDGLSVDEEGSDLDGPQAARLEAMAVLPAIARDLARDGAGRTLTATVRDESGRVLLRASLALAYEWAHLKLV